MPPQDETKVVAAATGLAQKFPPDEVATYFLTLLLQDASVWQGLASFLETTAGQA